MNRYIEDIFNDWDEDETPEQIDNIPENLTKEEYNNYIGYKVKIRKDSKYYNPLKKDSGYYNTTRNIFNNKLNPKTIGTIIGIDYYIEIDKEEDYCIIVEWSDNYDNVYRRKDLMIID
jgi:hypothetical protein